MSSEEPPTKKTRKEGEEVVENPSSSVATSSSSPLVIPTPNQSNGETEPVSNDQEEDVTEIPNPSNKQVIELPNNEDTTPTPDSSEDRPKKRPLNGQQQSEGAEKRDGPEVIDLSKVMERIKSCEDRIDHITGEANTQVLLIERRLRELKKPVFHERSRLVRFIPEFWLTTLINHPQISSRITELDEECLRYLKSLEVEEFDDSQSGFKIAFHFSPNQYFENSVIKKEVHYSSQGGLWSQSTEIKWKHAKNLIRIQASYPGNRNIRPQPSFFTWFLDHSNPGMDEIAEIIREDIWPNPLKYFQACSDQQAIELSSDGIVLDSSGDEMDDSVLVLGDEDEDEPDEDEEDEEDDEDILLLDNIEDIDEEEEDDEFIEEVDEEEEEEDFDEDEDQDLLEEEPDTAVSGMLQGKAKKSDKFVAKIPKWSDSESARQVEESSDALTQESERAKTGVSNTDEEGDGSKTTEVTKMDKAPEDGKALSKADGGGDGKT